MLGMLIGVGAVIVLVAVGNGSSVAVQGRTRLGTNSLLSSQRGRFGPGTTGAASASSARKLTIDDAVALSDTSQAPDIKTASPVVSTSASCVYAGTSHTDDHHGHLALLLRGFQQPGVQGFLPLE